MLKSTNFDLNTVRPPLLYFESLPLAVADLMDTLPDWARGVIPMLDAPERKGWAHNIDRVALMWDAYQYYCVVRGNATDRAMEDVALYVAFNSAVYDPNAQLGENESNCLNLLGGMAEEEPDSVGAQLDRVEQMIKVGSPIHRTLPLSEMAALAVDLDRYVLALPFPAFLVYLRAMEAEKDKAALPTMDWLNQLLRSEAIFVSGRLGPECEYHARANLQLYVLKATAKAVLPVESAGTFTADLSSSPRDMIAQSERLFFAALARTGTHRSLSVAKTHFETAVMWFEDFERKQQARSADKAA